jgi:hypothetical protein
MSDSESFAASAREFNAQAAEFRAALWPCTFTLSTDPASPKAAIEAYARPSERSRVPDDLRTGYIARTVRAFCLLPSQIPTGATVRLGAEFTVTADPDNPANVGTVWHCFDLIDSAAGSELRAVCFRLD